MKRWLSFLKIKNNLCKEIIDKIEEKLMTHFLPNTFGITQTDDNKGILCYTC